MSSEGQASGLTYPVQCSALRKNGLVIIKDRPCKITDMSTHKTGKHGGAKVNMTAVDIFTGRKYEESAMSTMNMDVPFVTRTEYTLLDIADGYYHLINTDTNEEREDIKFTEDEVGLKIQEAFQGSDKNIVVTILKAMGEEAAISFKEEN
ncbi:translation initiation factor eIF-5A [Fonticula alba]|uniref:Eukaryotic translation initiation factor 5A n=1 Tax=Fonticula alba TaxID=691883 RepID=A0A058Z4U1_FONAL|nr:translation initiation factor eIF-5A [Fonticula alba]KCV68938.1 translation initiation factor eIF-5A [Fonticula alba]|eukprot:XP_009496509.1 translation initiation factor eIF-5A [Fonticula alba]